MRSSDRHAAGRNDRTRQDPGPTKDPASADLDRVAVPTGPDDLPPGTLAGQYVLQRPIGSGGGGTVYAAEHRLLKRRAAVKVLRHDKATVPSMLARFLREAMAVNMIRHPNIIDIFEFGELSDGRPFYVMELLDGTNLQSLLELHGRFPAAEVLAILTPVCDALEAAHRAGVVHRDLKASNISVIDHRKGRVIKLLDFGLAKLLHPAPNAAGLTGAGSVLGTTHNMAPEQIRAEPIDARADIYALGVLLYQLLTGQYPFRAALADEIAWKHLTAPVPRASQAAPVPTALDAVVQKAMAKERDQRFPSAAAFLDALRDACGVRAASAQDAAVAAVGIYVEARTDEGLDEQLHEVLFDDLGVVLDSAEQMLVGESFILAIRTSNALLAVKKVGRGSGAVGERAAINLGRALWKGLSGRCGADGRVHVNVAIRLDDAVIRTGADGEVDVTGGPLLSIEQWVPQQNMAEVAISRRPGPRSSRSKSRGASS